MAGHKAYSSTVIQAGRLGGTRRGQNLSPEKKREIGQEAAAWAASKRAGGPAKAEILRLYLAQLRNRDAELSDMVKVIMSAPARYRVPLTTVLTEDEWEAVIECYSAAMEEWLMGAHAGSQNATTREASALQEGV